MTTVNERRDERIDVWEHRATSRFEVRSNADELVLTGYASTFEPYEMYGGPAAGGWIEQLDHAAFNETLAEKPDLHLLINHEGMPLARTKSGTLDISADRRGLKVVARLLRRDPDVQRLEPKMDRGDISEMSFAFRVKMQKWSAAPGFEDDDHSLRLISRVSLHKGDVSIVNFGANPTTHAEIKSMDDALEVLANCERGQLLELRADTGLISRALDNIKAIQGKPPAARATMSLREALVRQGLADPDGTLLSLTDALAQQ